VVAVYVAAQLAGARHAGWVAAALGIPLAAIAAVRLRASAAPVGEGGGRPAASASVLAAAVPLCLLVLLPVLPLWLLGPDKGGDYATPTHWGGLHARSDGLRFLLETYRPALDLAAMLAMAAGLVTGMRLRLLVLHPFGWVLLAASAIAYLAIPNELHGTWGADASTGATGRTLIPPVIDQNPCAQSRRPMDMMRQGWSRSLSQA
jgi:hypothetical protein